MLEAINQKNLKNSWFLNLQENCKWEWFSKSVFWLGKKVLYKHINS